jgi:hypothetical protein
LLFIKWLESAIKVIRMELFLRKFLSRRGALALLPALVFGLAQHASAQSSPVSGYTGLVDDLNVGVTATITNFGSNSTSISPFILDLTTGQTVQITNNATIDGGTNFVQFQGNGVTRLFYVHPNASLTLNNLELIGGWSTNGGAIYNEGTLIISNCLITGNTASNVSGANGGSGFPGLDSNGTNGGSGDLAAGGAIYSTGPVFISYSILTNNNVQAGNGGNGGNAGGAIGSGGNAGNGGYAYGGALYTTGSTNVFYMTEFANNQCTAGNGGTGGSFASNGPLDSLNFGGAAGLGGFCAGGAAFIAGPIYVTNCIFFGNEAQAGSTGAAEVDADGGGADGSAGGDAIGGALFITNQVANADFVNTIFAFNSCLGGAGGDTSLTNAIGGVGGAAVAGGLWSGATLVQMQFCTLATNTLLGGAAGLNSDGGINGTIGGTAGWDIYRTAGVFELSDSILSGNAPGGNAPNAAGVTDAGYNIISDASVVKNTIVTTTKLNTNPDLNSGLSPVGRTAIGGPSGFQQMWTLELLGGSPAASFVPGVPGSTFPATDEVLDDRSTPTSAGAFEYNNIGIIVTNALPANLIISTLPGTNLTGAGDTVAFTNTIDAQIYSNTTPLGYQWQLDGTNIFDNANYSGTTSNILVVRRITATDEGDYTVLVSPSLLEGAITSSVVVLILTNPPAIKAEPVSQINRPVGSIVTFTLNVGPFPQGYSYQWLFGETALSLTNLPARSEYSGTNSNVLTIDPATDADAGFYSVIVSNGFNSIDYGVKTSAVVRLTIVPDHARPTITLTSPPANVRTNVLVMEGTASDNAQVTNVLYWITNINAGLIPVTNVLTGNATLTTNGSTNLNGPNTMLWSITNMPLPGTNILLVQSVDYSSNVSAVLTRRFFYEVPSSLTLMSNTVGGAGTLTGHAFIHGDATPSNHASLNIGEGYTIVAVPNAASLLGNWTNSSGTNVFITNGNTLHFVMESNTVIQAYFVSNIFLGEGMHGTFNGLFYVTNVILTNDVVTNQIVGTNGMTNDIVFTNQTVTSEVAFASAGMIDNLVLSRQGSFSGKLLLAGDSYTLSGTFDAFGNLTNHVIARSAELGGPLIVDMNLDTNGSGIITGFVTNAAWPTNSYLWAALAAATPGTSNYTLLMFPPNGESTNTASPSGYGYALMTDRGGTVTLSGGLADGTTFSQTVPASQAGDVPVYVSLYSKTGFLFGWLNLTNLDSTYTSDGLIWIKGVPARPTLLFPDGFTNRVYTEGSAWTKPGAITLASTNTLVISDAGLDLVYTAGVKNNNELVNSSDNPTNSLTGTINLNTGLLQITFGNGNGRSTTRGYGAVLQNMDNAAGYFVIGTNTGSIILSGVGSPLLLHPLIPVILPPPVPEGFGGSGQDAGLIIYQALHPVGPPLPPPVADAAGALGGGSAPTNGP